MSFTEGILPEALASRASFAELLRAFTRGHLAYGDFLAQVDRRLAADEARVAMLHVLRNGELQNPLPPDVFQAVLDRITHWPSSDDRADYLGEAPTIILDGERSGHRVSVSVGDILQARFELVELIGEGGMSRVYKARDLRRVEAASPDPYVAVKVLTLPFNEYFGSLAALQGEAQKLQSLAHPNIVRVFDCDRDGEVVFMTMEYLEGARLTTSLTAEKAQSVILQIAEALEYAHCNHIVHGDLKPRNVIVNERNEVKVIDFGIARWIPRAEAGPEGRAAAQSRVALAATMAYASPQVLARQVPEPADDVYALACLAYQLLAGKHPFANGAGARASKEAPPPLPGLTPAQYAAIANGLKFERQDRTATVREFIGQFVASPPKRAWPKYALGVCAAMIIAFLGWYLGHAPHSGTVRSASLPLPATTVPGPAPGTAVRDCPTCPVMTVLPSGKFQQGSAADSTHTSSFEQPQHWVSIVYPIAMSTSEITVGEFQEFVAATGREMQGCDTYDGAWQRRPDANWKDPGFTQGATYPVTCVSWEDASAYAHWLSVKSGHPYRLPSASEWEYAARAGGNAAQPWNAGGSDACAFANVADQSAAQRYPGWNVFACSDGYVTTAPVGSFKANAFGLNDMLGNVVQWTQDCWKEDYSNAPTDGAARREDDCADHELRGGSWFSNPAYVTASYRHHFPAQYRASSVGFRLVREINP
jgi:formylglycine-generating enzyme required for sulfatase activity/predicted Ser/Thr protein kinase